MKKTAFFCLIIIGTLFLSGCKTIESTSKISIADFKYPPDGIKIHTWWHWMDGSITRDGITRDLEAMKQQGIGQATILNIGLFNGKDFGVKKVVFNSPQWHELFIWALKEANRLGITLGAHNCDGWSSSGGPWITPELSMKQFVWTKTYVSGSNRETIKLPQPQSINDFYKDAAVIAYKTATTANSFQKANPVCKFNDSIQAKSFIDGSPATALVCKKGDKILISFPIGFQADKIVIHPRRKFMWNDLRVVTSNYVLSSSNDGVNFKKVKEFEITGLNKSVFIEIPETEAKYFQIEINEISTIDAWIDFTIAEIELLMGQERPSYDPSIPHLLEKTVDVKAADPSYFYSSGSTPSEAIDRNNIIDLTEKMDKNSTLHWTVPDGNWCILRFGYTTTGALNGPATKEGTGFECDKMDTVALNVHFNNFSKKLITDAGLYVGNTFKFLLIDSWECGFQNWTANLPAEFEKNRGYSLINWIPVLCGETVGDAPLSEAFLYDFRRTVADMVETNYYKHFRDLCHKGKVEMHAEIIYGDANYPPVDIIKSNTYTDLPMFEFWSGVNKNSFIEYNPSKPFESFPVFASALYNLPVVGSEAYTSMTHYSESFNELKPYGDRAFCSGINQIILHSYVHQPFDKKPGITLGSFSSHFNRNNPYWQFASEWLKYQSRIQYILQKGTIASNILYYVGDQLPQYIDNPVVNSLPFGYRAVACNFDVLKNKATVKNGKILLGNGIEYSMLILPESNSMELSTLETIASLVEKGMVIVGQKPVKQLSLNGLTQGKERFKHLSQKVWGTIDGKKVTENSYGKGKVFYGLPIAEILAACEIIPEFKTNVQDSMNLIYIHKKYGGYDVFFVANQLDAPLNRECIFSVGEKAVKLWNPIDGSIIQPALFTVENGRMRIPVSFKPRESLFFIFENQKPGDYLNKVISENKQIFPSSLPADMSASVPFVSVINNENWFSSSYSRPFTFISTKNKKTDLLLKQPEVYEIKDFDGEIEFTPAYEATIAATPINELKPLTDFDDPQIKYFSGTAKYTIKFSIPANFDLSSTDVLLDLGKFESVAKVSLNNIDLGIVWMIGSTKKINGLLQKENTLEIVIANIFRNRIIGDYIQYGELKNAWTSAPIDQFLDKNKPLKPSGLIGPIRIIKELKVNPSNRL